MQSFDIAEEIIPCINLYSLRKDTDDFSMIRLCKNAIEHNFQSITIDMAQIENVWPWCESSNVKLIGSINMIHNTMSPTILFKNIKSVFDNGADMVEVVMPLEFSNMNEDNVPAIMDEYLSVISEAKNFKEAKVCIETGYSRYLSQIKLCLNLIQKHNIDIIKTSSSFYLDKFSDISHLNLILDNIDKRNTKIDFLFDVKTSEKSIISDTYRLAKKSQIPADKSLIISYPIEFL